MEKPVDGITNFLIGGSPVLSRLNKSKYEECLFYEKSLKLLPEVKLTDSPALEEGVFISGSINLKSKKIIFTFDFNKDNTVNIYKEVNKNSEKIFNGPWDTGFHLISELIIQGFKLKPASPQFKKVTAALSEIIKRG